jgi:hypothetical protein
MQFKFSHFWNFPRALMKMTELDKKPLGRWALKTCDEITTGVNAVYQNRDHCGDTICKTPKRASEYIKPQTLKN